MNLAHLQETRTAKIAEMRALGDTPDAVAFDKLETEVRDLDRQIKRAATLAEFERQAETADDKHADKELRSYSIAKALREAMSGSLTGLEREMHDELSRGRETRGVMVPTSIILGETRAQTVGTASAGGNTVQTQLGGLIDRLRPTLKVQSMGATVISGLVGNLDLPRLTAGPTSAWVAEDGSATASDSTFDKVSMTPKTVTAEQYLSRRLMLQNSVALEDVLRRDLGYTLSQALDKAAINGAGVHASPATNEPTGVLTAVTENATTETVLSDIAADLIAALEIDDVDGTGAFLTNALVMQKARKLKDGEGRNLPLSEIFHGAPVNVTNQVPTIEGEDTDPDTNPLIYGAWSNLFVGYWSGVDILANPYSDASKGGLRLHAFLDADIAIRHDEAFAWKAI
jgi:HK97 family phage major capsid protein